MDGLEQATDVTGTSGRGNACDCFGPHEGADRPGRNGSGGDFEEYIKLARMVEGEVIPRLLLSHKADARRLRSPESSVLRLDNARVEEFARIVITDEVETAEAYLENLMNSGMSSESLLADLLGPTARRLGEYWLEDDCSFFDVTMGLCRLHQILRDFGRDHVEGLPSADPSPRALLAPAPGEQHTFGLLMVEEHFRRGGWDPFLVEDGDPSRIVRAAREDWFAIAGFSMSSERYRAQLADLIAEVKAASRNPDLVVMVGGQWFNADIGRVADVGADISAVDGRQAIVQIRSMLRPADARRRLAT
ncbi:cobalamin B12-binding domain-containing protein [Prosthecomicrobium sp. N25]|uniref:cobalamin B12-binding domain-containing protein n=1 Tax=Prosthecomicrobium sp. N25 TaxID=3129254 RepID=UPI00307763A9